MNPTGSNATPSTSTFVTSGAVLLLAQACRWRAPDATVALADHAVRLARSENRVENALLAEGWLAHGLVVIGHGATAAPRAASALAEATRVGATVAAGRLRVELATIARTVDAAEQAQRLLDPVLALPDADPLLRADACLEAAMGATRDTSESRDLLDRAVRSLTQLGGEEGELGLAHVEALAAARARREGRLTESVKRARDGLTRSLGNSMTGGPLEPVSPHLTTLLCYELCQALVANGHPEPVPELSRPILGWAVRPGSLVPAARLHLLLASAVQRPAGAFEDALASATWVAEAIESRDLPELEARCQTVLGEIWDSSGNVSQAVRATRQAHLAHRAHTERVGQVRALLAQVVGGALGAPETGRTGRPSDPRSLARRVARGYAEDEEASSLAGLTRPIDFPGSSGLPGRPLDARGEAGGTDQPRHGKHTNGYHGTNGFDSGRRAGGVARSAPERPDNRPGGSRLSGSEPPGEPVDPAFSNEFGARLSQFSESAAQAPAQTPGDSGPPTLPRGLSGRMVENFGSESAPVIGSRADPGGPPSRQREPEDGDRREGRGALGPSRSGRRRRPSPEDVALEAPENSLDAAQSGSRGDDEFPGVVWLSPEASNVVPSSTGHTRVSLTQRELADQLAALADSGEARPAHLVLIDISMPDGSRCGPAARTVAERVADQLDGQRPPGARLFVLDGDTVTVSLTDADPQAVNRWLRTVSGGISRRWASLSGELPSVATFRIVVRPLDPRWSINEHLAEVRSRLHPEAGAAQARTENPSGRLEVNDEPDALGPDGHTPGDDSSGRNEPSGRGNPAQGYDTGETVNRDAAVRARHSVGGQEASEGASTGQRRWLSAAPGSGGRRRRPESELGVTEESGTAGPPIERDPLTDPDPFGMPSASRERLVSRRDTAAVADHAHPDGWPIDDEFDGVAVTSSGHAGSELHGGSGRAEPVADRFDGIEPVIPTELRALGTPAQVDADVADERTSDALGSTQAAGSEAASGLTEASDPSGSAELDRASGSVDNDGSARPAPGGTSSDPAETDSEQAGRSPAGRRQKRSRKTEISTLAMESVAPPEVTRDTEQAGAESTPAPEKPPARNWDRPVSELSFAELIDGALAAYREA